MALPHLVHDGENGYLFEPGNVDDLADDARARAHRCRRTSWTCSRTASLRIVAAHDIQRTISTFESLYRGEPVADPVTDAAPSVPHVRVGRAAHGAVAQLVRASDS